MAFQRRDRRTDFDAVVVVADADVTRLEATALRWSPVTGSVGRAPFGEI